MQVVFEMNDMKKLLQEFKKNVLQEGATTKYSDAIAVLKFFINAKVSEPTISKLTQIIQDKSDIEEDLSMIKKTYDDMQYQANLIGMKVAKLEAQKLFIDQYKSFPSLANDTPEDTIISQKKIQDKFTKQHIADILRKMDFDGDEIHSFIQYLEQTVPAPEEVDIARKREPDELGSEDIATPKGPEGPKGPEAEGNTNPTNPGRRRRPPPNQNAVPDPRDLRNKFNPVSGRVT